MNEMTAAAERITEFRNSLNLHCHAVLDGILQEGERNAYYITAGIYSWWHAVGNEFKPRSIAEMGSRHGYSLWALWKGSGRPSSEMSIWVYDDERDGGSPLTYLETTFRANGFVDLHITRRDTQTLETLGIPHPVDLSVVDAWHTEDGVQKECELALAATRPGGIIVVDDTQPGGCVRRGCEKFIEKHNLEWAYLPTYQGVHLLRVPG